MTSEQKRILVADIGAAHGIRGAVKLRLYTQNPHLIFSHPLYLDETGDETIRLLMDKVTNTAVLVRIEGVNDRTAAEKWRGASLYLDRNLLPEPDDDEYYYEDLKGLTVLSTDGTQIGSVVDVENFGASDLLNIKPTAGSEFYIPFTPDYVPVVDMDAGTLTIQNYTVFAGLEPDTNTDAEIDKE